jgi:hypothetical protein
MAHVLKNSCFTHSFFRFVERIKSFPGLGLMRSFCTNLIGNAEGIYHIRWRPLKPAIEALSTKRLSLKLYRQCKLVVVVVWTSKHSRGAECVKRNLLVAATAVLRHRNGAFCLRVLCVRVTYDFLCKHMSNVLVISMRCVYCEVGSQFLYTLESRIFLINSHRYNLQEYLNKSWK